MASIHILDPAIKSQDDKLHTSQNVFYGAEHPGIINFKAVSIQLSDDSSKICMFISYNESADNDRCHNMSIKLAAPMPISMVDKQ